MSVTPDYAPHPVAAVTSVLAIKGRLGIPADDLSEDVDIAGIVDAVDVVVRGLAASDRARGLEAWPADLTLGATMLGARLHRRRNTPDGVQAFAEGGAVYIQRNDPDVALMLQLGDHARPSVG